jgi:hypothetical protein
MLISKGTSYAIDFIKGVCSLAILLMHVSWLTEGSQNWIYHDFFSKLTNFMVLFFIINGFLFSVKNSNNNHNINYLKRILKRIYPIYLFVFFCNILLIYYFSTTNPNFFIFCERLSPFVNIDFGMILTNLFLLDGLFPQYLDKLVDGSWFLCNIIYINVFFLLIPNLFSLKRVLYFFIFFTIFELILFKSLRYVFNLNNYFTYHFFLRYIPAFLLGILIDLLSKNSTICIYINKYRYFVFIFSLTLIVLSFFSLFGFLNNIELIQVVYFLFVFSIILLNIRKEKINFLESFIIKIGKQSLNFFLLHVLLMWPLAFFLKNSFIYKYNIGFFESIWSRFIFLFIALLVSTLISLYIFDYFIKLIHKYINDNKYLS